MTTDADYREVRFDIYCGKCTHALEPATSDICDDCLEHTTNLYSQRPVNWEEIEMTADQAYEVIKSESIGMDAIYEDYIIRLVGTNGLATLQRNKYLESCGVVNGRQLYALVEKKGE